MKLSWLFCASTALAVYVDEAYNVDWHYKLIGPVKSGVEVDDSLVAVSELGVVGAINKSDGNLIWRRRFNNPKFSATKRTVVVGDGKELIAHAPSNGALEWRSGLADDAIAVGVVGDSVYACTKDHVYEYDSAGNQLWSSQVTGCQYVLDINGPAIVTDSNNLIVIENRILSTKKIGNGTPLQVAKEYVLWQDSKANHVAKLSKKGVAKESKVSGGNMWVNSDSVVVTGKETTVFDRDLKQMGTHEGEEGVAFEGMVQRMNGQLVSADWTREEGLAGAVGVTFVDMEVDTGLEQELEYEEHADIFSAYIRRVSRHIADFKQLKFSKRPVTDVFGFQKLLVVATRYGRVAAFDTLDGTLVWDLDTINDIFEIRSAGSTVYVIGESGQVVQVNGQTGKVIDQSSLHVNIETLLFSSNATHKTIGAYTSAGIVEMEGTFKDLYFTVHDNHTIYGHNGKHTTWEFTIGEGYEIVATAKRHAEDVTASIGTILADRSVLYKYLHPNTIAVAAKSSDGQLAVYLLDIVTGRVLHSKLHREKVTGNVGLVYGEHWVVYSYQSVQPIPGQKIAVWDLFESELPNERWSNKPYSSFDAFPLPHVKSQAFFYPAPIGSLAVSRTRFGITNRDILATLQDGQIVTLSKRALDARRPLTAPTKEQQAEEGLFKYEPVIPKDPNSVISHSRQVIVDHIATEPASVESTSLLAGWGGLDLFFTRVTPSLPFDTLNRNFGKSKLIYTIIALLVLVNVLRPMVNRRAVNQKWQ